MASDAGSDMDANKLVLVAVVQWEATASTATTKLRVHSLDLHGETQRVAPIEPSEDSRKSSVICTGNDLQRLLLREVPRELIGDDDFEFDEVRKDATSSVSVEVYDPCSMAYILLDDLRNVDILEHVGSRIRIHVCVASKATSTGSSRQHPQKEILAIQGRCFPYKASEGLVIGGHRIIVQEIPNQQNAGTGVTIWDGALLLSKYLEKQPSLVKSKRVLELGSGCGLVGIVAGVLGAKEVLLTDLEYALPNMRDNVNRHSELFKIAGCERIKCATLDWREPPTPLELGHVFCDKGFMIDDNNTHGWEPNLILVADCVWMEDLVAPLLNTIRQLQGLSLTTISNSACGQKCDSTMDQRPTVLICYQRRGKATHQAFWYGIHSIGKDIITEVDVTLVGLTKPESISLIQLN